jgi:hypothetical protein
MTDDEVSREYSAAEYEYVQREAFRKAALLDRIMETHSWPGGYFCKCGRALNSAENYARHVIAEWEDGQNAPP